MVGLPLEKGAKAQELRKESKKKKQCNGMEGGKTRLTGLCCSPLPCRGSLDASPSVEGTAERLQLGERPWGENEGWWQKERGNAFLERKKRGSFQTVITDAWREPIESEKIRQGAWKPMEGVCQGVGKCWGAEKGG